MTVIAIPWALHTLESRLADAQRCSAAADAARQKVADSEPLYEYVRRYRDALSGDDDELHLLHKFAAPEAELGNWAHMQLLLMLGAPLRDGELVASSGPER